MNAEPPLITKSEQETHDLGVRVGRLLRAGAVTALYGELGTGKTVLTRGIAFGLGIRAPVTSPTFTVVQEYVRPDGSWLFHLDMYRIPDEAEALAFGIEEYLFVDDGVTVVEWPERIAGLLALPPPGRAATEVSVSPDRRLGAARSSELFELSLEHVDPTTRRIRLPSSLRAALPADGDRGVT